MATGTASSVPLDACREGDNTCDFTVSKVLVKVLTDKGKAVKQEEWVILIVPDYVYALQTDSYGFVEFAPLYVPPYTRCFVILPDVLEAWDEEGNDPKQIVLHPCKTSLEHESCEMDQSLSTPIEGLPPAIDLIRTENKDQIAQRARSVSSNHYQSPADYDDNSYRSKDQTKHCVYTRENDTNFDDKPDEIVINRLTPMEKFRHFRDAFVSGKARYCIPRKNNYTGNKQLGFNDVYRHWNWAEGAVCNQLANFFLSYWFNYNAAWNPYIVMLDWHRLMDIFSSDLTNNSETQGKSMRGFKNFARAIPDSLSEDERKDFGDNIRNLTHIRGDPYQTIKIHVGSPGGSTVADWDSKTQRFISKKLMDELEEFNIYGVSGYSTSKSDPTGGSVDHHGGILYKDIWPDDAGDKKGTTRIRKMAADGDLLSYFKNKSNGQDYHYPKKDKLAEAKAKYKALNAGEDLPEAKKDNVLYEHSNLYEFYKDTNIDKTVEISCYSLRFWALERLRLGGYVGKGEKGDYQPDGVIADGRHIKANGGVSQYDKLTLDVQHSLPRFIKWQGIERTETGLLSIDEFLNL